MDATYRYRAFISYSHADEAVARWLHRTLERYRPPKASANARLSPIFRDRDELRAAGSLSAVLEDALDSSEYLIVICSPEGAASHWVNEEIRYFSQKRDASRILCLIARGAGSQIFPPALTESNAEPLAADLQRDGRRGALLKIAAALLEVRYDDLARREETRRVRRLVTVAGCATAAFAAMTALATFAMLQRAEAVRQETVAVREAEVANQVADFLVELFYIADPQTENPDTITARTLLERGAANIDDRLEESPDIKARLLFAIGRVEANLGLLTRARETLLEATELAPLDDDRSAEIWITAADIQSRMSLLDAAEAHLRAVADFMRSLPDPLDPPVALKFHKAWASVLIRRRPGATASGPRR